MIASIGNWLLASPLWVIGLVVFGGMILCSIIGVMLRRRHRDASVPEEDAATAEGQEGYIVSAVMGLLALLVGFTFSLAIDRFDTRRTNVLIEANAIGTTYLRTQLLDAPHRARISKLLTDYTDNRITLAGLAPSPEQQRLLARNDSLITDLWTATVAAFPSMKGFDFSSSYLESMNEVIDMDAARKTSRKAHVPPEVFLILFVYQFIAAGVIGYVLVGRRGQQAAVFLFLLFGISLLLVIDIDRPTSGGIIESQEPMLDLQASMRAQPPAIFDRFDAPPPASAPAR